MSTTACREQQAARDQYQVQEWEAALEQVGDTVPSYTGDLGQRLQLLPQIHNSHLAKLRSCRNFHVGAVHHVHNLFPQKHACDVWVQSAVNGKNFHLHKKYYQKIAKIDKILCEKRAT